MFTCATDLGWGDNGKGKVADLLAKDYDIVVRYNGGPNAGHTVKVDGKCKHFHQLPSAGEVRVLASGMALNPCDLFKEITDNGLDPKDVIISHKAHCIMPWHIAADAKKGGKIGTTRRGVGPCYADKMHRWNAIRMGDLCDKLRDEKLNRFFAADSILHGKELWDEYNYAARELKQYIGDAGRYLRQAVSQQKNILFETANGIHLDVDHGTYPYVTSSAVGPAAIPQSCELPNFKLDRIIGIIKCHATRVGEGPFPSEIPQIEKYTDVGTRCNSDIERDCGRLDKCPKVELKDKNGEEYYGDCNCEWCISHKIREKGAEYGTTTGRPRRIGWFDLDLTKHAVELTGATELAIMHCDTLANMDFPIKLKQGDKWIEVEPWKDVQDTNFWIFAKKITDFIGIPITIISYGADRDDTIFRI